MSTPVTRRYALALYEEARAAGVAERVDADVRALGETLAASRDLRAVFASPVVPRHKKAAVIERLFKEGTEPLVLRFIQLLLAKEREDQLPDVVAAYNELLDSREGVTEAHVRSARPLADEEAERLRRTLEARTGHAVRLRREVEPGLLGGLVVQVGDRVYDGSLRNQLGVLREQLHTRAQLSTN